MAHAVVEPWLALAGREEGRTIFARALAIRVEVTNDPC